MTTMPPMMLNSTPSARLYRAQNRSDRKSTRLNSSHANISYAVFCLKKKDKHSPSPALPDILSPPAFQRPHPPVRSPLSPPCLLDCLALLFLDRSSLLFIPSTTFLSA